MSVNVYKKQKKKKSQAQIAFAQLLATFDFL